MKACRPAHGHGGAHRAGVFNGMAMVPQWQRRDGAKMTRDCKHLFLKRRRVGRKVG